VTHLHNVKLRSLSHDLVCSKNSPHGALSTSHIQIRVTEQGQYVLRNASLGISSSCVHVLTQT